MIPIALQEGDQVRLMRMLDQLHDQTAGLGSDDGLSDDEMEVLHQTAPGTLPWERQESNAESNEQL